MIFKMHKISELVHFFLKCCFLCQKIIHIFIIYGRLVTKLLLFTSARFSTEKKTCRYFLRFTFFWVELDESTKDELSFSSLLLREGGRECVCSCVCVCVCMCVCSCVCAWVNGREHDNQFVPHQPLISFRSRFWQMQPKIPCQPKIDRTKFSKANENGR